MKTDNIQALKDVLAGFSKAETEFDNYINTTRAGEILAETVEYVIADETGTQSV